MTIATRLQQLRDEWPTATEKRRQFILMQVESLKRAQAWYAEKRQLEQQVAEAKEIFQEPTILLDSTIRPVVDVPLATEESIS